MTSISALEELASYVPALILRRLAADSAATLTPAGERFPAAVLMADLSGFTALTERFAHANPAGAEELTRILDRYFGHLVGIVTGHGGDVVKFAGDGMLALWYGDEPLAVLTRRAVQCGMAVQMMTPDAWGGSDHIRQTTALKVRVGVGAGAIATMHVGGVFGRWELLIVGEPLRTAGNAEAQAQPGAVVIAPDAWRLIAEACRGTRLPSGYTRLDGLRAELPLRPLTLPTLIPPMADALRAYIPRAVLTRVDADQAAWIAEQRRVTVLFIHLPDLRADTPLQRAQALMRALQTNLYRYEGSISRLGADSKGPTVMAALGLPPLAHEDDPGRGMHAARDIHAALTELGFACAIGIATGQALCGAVGGVARREYTMMGPIVNHAARLMQVAAAQTPADALPLICDAPTFHAVRARMAFESLPPLALKGVSEPAPTFRLLQAGEARPIPPAAPDSTALLGRDRELTALEALLTRLVHTGVGGIALIEGDAGIGKTGLLRQLRERAAVHGIATIQSAAQPIAGAPYSAWRAIILALLADAAEPAASLHPADVIVSSLLADPELQRLAPLLGAILAIDLPDTAFTAQMTGSVRADNTRAVLVRLLERAAARKPFLLTLDDAQWLDAGSWALLHAVLERRPPIAITIALRPMQTPSTDYQRIVYHPNSIRQIIRGLDRAALRNLIAQRLANAHPADDVVNLIADRTQGNPLFSAELAVALHEAGVIRVRNARAHLAAAPHAIGPTIAELRLPETVHGMLISRIDRLEPAQQLTLKVASVIGPSFSITDLAAIHPMDLPPEQLGAQLFILQQAGLIALEALEPELLYAFRPAMVAEVAYSLMSFAQRRRLHHNLAVWLERRPAPDAIQHYAQLARHWQAAEEPVRARASLGLAGEAALRAGAHHEAITFFSRALELADTAHDPLGQHTRACWEGQLGEAYHNTGRLIESRELLEQAARRLGDPFPQQPGARIAGVLRAVGGQAGRRLGLRKRAPTSDPTAQRETARIYLLIAQLAYYENQSVPALYAVLHGLNLAEGLAPAPELASAYAGVQLALGATPLARIYQRLAQRAAYTVGHLPTLTWIAEVQALHAIGRADWRRARAAVGYGLQLAARLGDQRRRAEFIALDAMIMAQRGAYVYAAQACAELYALGRRTADVQVQSWGLIGEAENLLHLGDERRASELLNEAEALLTENFGHAQADELWLYGLMARAALQRGDTARARSLAATAVQLGGALPPTALYAIGGFSATADVLVELLARSTYTDRSDRRTLHALARRACLMLGYLAAFFPLARPAAGRVWRRLI
jgi:class 3 adenylate cyclase